MPEPKPVCTATAKTGLACRNSSKPEWDGLCFMHWCQATGRPMPQTFRRKVQAGSVAELLGAFGLTKRDIVALRAAVPEVDNIMSKNTKLVDALDLACRALAIRLIAKPDRAVADSLSVLARFVQSQANDGLAKPIPVEGGGFVDLFGED